MLIKVILLRLCFYVLERLVYQISKIDKNFNEKIVLWEMPWEARAKESYIRSTFSV